MMNFDTMQKQNQESFDQALKSMNAMTKGFQDIAKETADFTKKSFETSSAATEKLIASKSLDKAFEVQAEYAKNSYEAFIAQASRMGELYAEMAKEAYKPFENALPKASK